jgi:hypothetical protein
MLRPCCSFRELSCALAVLATCLSVTQGDACAEDKAYQSYYSASSETSQEAAPLDTSAEFALPDGEPWTHALPPAALFADCDPLDEWRWQVTPPGLIYRSYLAGVHEPRTGIVSFHEGSNRTIWDTMVGGRGGVLRFGTGDPLRPEGYQLDVYGAAIARLDVENEQDLDSTDYVFGFPITYGFDQYQFKFGYGHISSHLGDELALRDPSTLAERVNYVRDYIVFGTSVYPHPTWRMYGEAGWAFHNSGGAEPWEGQFGTELTLPGSTGLRGTPFVAVNGRVREEHNFGGDVTAQTGWLWRGVTGQAIRIGAHYYNGKSSQMQFFDTSEEQVGMGLWYDF